MEMKLYYDGKLNGMTPDAIQLCREFMGTCEYMVLGTQSVDKKVRLSAVTHLPAYDLQEIYFSTDPSSMKVRNLQVEPDCEILMTNGTGQLIAGGKAKVITEQAVKEAKWQPWMAEHFKGVDDEGYCLVKILVSYVRVMLI